MNPRLLRPLASGFNPRQITGLRYWLDASDSSTITIDTGVSEWRDKSGNGFHFTQTTGNNQPGYSDTLNGRKVITFDGSNDVLTRASVANTAGTDSTGGAVFVAFRFTGSVGTYTVFYQNGDNNHRDVFFGTPFGSHLRAARLAGQPAGVLPSSAKSAVYSITANVASSTHLFRVDGSTKSTQAADHANWRARAAGTLSVGRGPQNDFFTGFVCEIIEYGTAITAAQASTIDRYLANKWGIPLQ
jgi:hypothetical protein